MKRLCLMSFFQIASPFNEAPYKDAAERNTFGGLSLDGFLSEVCVHFT